MFVCGVLLFTRFHLYFRHSLIIFPKCNATTYDLFVYFIYFFLVKSSNIHLFEDKQSWLDALKSCETKGGRMLLQSEYSSSGISDVISSSFEFWIGDYVYSNWMSIEGCYHMDTLQVQLKMPMPIKIKSPCWNECHQNGYKYFALRVTSLYESFK